MRDAYQAGAEPARRPATVVASKSEEQDGNVEAQIGLAGQCIARHGGDKTLQHGVTHADSEGSAGKSQDQAFGKKLGEDGGAARAESAANRQFLLSRHAARQQQIGDVDAGNEQNKPNGAQEQPEHLDAFFGQKIVLEPLDIGAPALVALGIHLGDVGGDGIHVLLRLLEGHARFKTAHHQEPVKVVIDLFRLEDQGNGELRLPGDRRCPGAARRRRCRDRRSCAGWCR